jgi:hypothetical protein
MGGAHGIYEDEKRCIKGFGGECKENRALGCPRHRWEDNIKMALQKAGWEHRLD